MMKTYKYYSEKVAFYYLIKGSHNKCRESIGYIKNPRSKGTTINVLENNNALTKILLRNEDFELYQHPYRSDLLLITHPDLPDAKFSVGFDRWDTHKALYGLTIKDGKFEGKFRFYTYGTAPVPSIIIPGDIEEEELIKKGTYMNLGQVSKFNPGHLYFNKSDRQYYVYLGPLKHNGLESVWGNYGPIKSLAGYSRDNVKEFREFIGKSNIFLSFCFKYNYSNLNFEQLLELALSDPSKYSGYRDEVEISILKSCHYFVDLGKFVEVKGGWEKRIEDVSYINIDPLDIKIKEELIKICSSGYISNNTWEEYKKRYKTSIESLINIYGSNIEEEIKKSYESRL